MKRIVLLCLPALVFLSYGCKKPSPSFELGIDVQQSFSNDLVQVYIDGVQVINKQLTSGNILAYCGPDGKILMTKKEGGHQLKVVVNNTVTYTESFNLSANLYVGIRYSEALGVQFVYSPEKFYYR
jgi:hypothetical protein